MFIARNFSYILLSMYILSCTESPECSSFLGKPETSFKNVTVKKIQYSKYAWNDPDESYSKSLFSSDSKIEYVPSDTLYLKESDKDFVEYEIVADSTIDFEEITIIPVEGVDIYNDKPHINEKKDSYAVGQGRAIFVFRPWLYVPRGEGGIVTINIEATKNKSCNATKTFLINVLNDKMFNINVTRGLNKSQNLTRIKLENKYKSLLNSGSLESKKYGRSRLKYLNRPLLEKELKYFKTGNYSNQQVRVEQGFKVILTLGQDEKVEVEPFTIKP